MSFKFPDQLVLESDAKHCYDELKTALTATDTEATLSQVSELSQMVLSTNQPDYAKVSAEQFLKMMLTTIQDSSVFDVILPTYPHDSFLQDLGGWFRREIQPNSLLSISVRRSIGGGIVLRSKNRLFDMSILPQVLAAKNKIPEVIRRV